MSIPVTAGAPGLHDLWGAFPAGPRRALAQSAAAEFGLRGYHATTTRHIASRAGMSPAGLYVHYASKADILFAIAQAGHASVLELLTAIASEEGTPIDRLHALVRGFVVWHAVNASLARVLQYEIKALEPDHYREVAALRRRTKNLLYEAVGSVSTSAPRREVVLRAIVSLGIDTARWYDPEREIAPTDLAGQYADLITDLLTPHAR